MTDDSNFQTSLPSAHIYEELMLSGLFGLGLSRPTLDENDPAGLCYTSATTGRPKGVTYTHRAQILHAMMECSADCGGRARTGRGDGGGAHVPRQQLGRSLLGDDDGSDTGAHRRAAGPCRRFVGSSTTIAFPSAWAYRRSGWGCWTSCPAPTKQFDLSCLRMQWSAAALPSPVSMIQAFKERLGVSSWCRPTA